MRRGGPRARPPPGWGASGGDWAPLDALEEEEERLARASGVGAGGGGGEKKEEEGKEGGEEEGEAAAAAAAPQTPEQNKGGGGESGGESGDESDDESDEDDDDDGWTTAAKSSAAQRRSRRTAARRAAREAAAAEAAAAAAAAAAEEEEEEEGWETASDDDEDDDDGDESDAPSSGDEREREGGGEEELGDDHNDPAAASPVSLVTSDFAMQNVALQMGLRVVTSGPNCPRVKEARRWALRCSACSFCSREAGRLFCPRCGNAALDKVELVVDFKTGAAAFGVRRSHCLRGTKFSLPKPRGGRGGSGPILREDQLLDAMARAKRSSRGRKGGAKSALAADDDPLLAPELATADAWFKASGGSNGGLSATAALGGATAALVAAAWKHNPNEARRWGGGVRASGSAGKRK